MFNKAGVADKLGMSYDEIISQYADSMDSLFESDNLDETATFNAYYSGDDLAGFSFEKDGEGATLYTILKDDVVAVDLALTWAVRAVHHSRVLQILLTVLQMASSQ